MIDKNYPLTKEILKKIFSVDIIIEHFGDEYIDLFKWIERFNLNVKDIKDWSDDDYLKSSEILINAFLQDIDSIELTPELLNEIALCTRYCFNDYVYDNKNHYHMKWNSVFTDDEQEWFPLDDGTPLAEAFGANGFYMLIMVAVILCFVMLSMR